MTLKSLKAVQVVGDKGVGKLGLLMSYIYNIFPYDSDHRPFIEETYRVIVTRGEDSYMLELFDDSNLFQGPYDPNRLRPLSLSQIDILLVCFSVTSPPSFENVREKLIPEMHHLCPDIPYLIVGTQIDLRDDPQVIEELARQNQRPVSTEQGERLSRELGAVKYVECSARTRKGVKNVFDEALDAALAQEPQPPVVKVKKTRKCVVV